WMPPRSIRILSAVVIPTGSAVSCRRYTGSREGLVTLSVVASGRFARSASAGSVPGARRDLAHLPDTGFAERPGHLRHLHRNIYPGDHHLPRRRAGPAVGRDQVPPFEAARRLRTAADPRQHPPRVDMDDRPPDRGAGYR